MLLLNILNHIFENTNAMLATHGLSLTVILKINDRPTA